MVNFTVFKGMVGKKQKRKQISQDERVVAADVGKVHRFRYFWGSSGTSKSEKKEPFGFWWDVASKERQMGVSKIFQVFGASNCVVWCQLLTL